MQGIKDAAGRDQSRGRRLITLAITPNLWRGSQTMRAALTTLIGFCGRMLSVPRLWRHQGRVVHERRGGGGAKACVKSYSCTAGTISSTRTRTRYFMVAAAGILLRQKNRHVGPKTCIGILGFGSYLGLGECSIRLPERNQGMRSHC